MTYPTTFGTPPDAQMLGPLGIPVYSTLTALGADQNIWAPAQMVAVNTPFMFLQAAQSGSVATSVVTSTANPNVAGGGGVTYWQALGGTVSPAFPPGKVQNVITALPGTYTGTGTGVLVGSANGAITSGSSDGATPAVGNPVLLPTGATHLTAVDAGPYVIVQVGSATTPFIIARPTWFANGSIIPTGFTITVGAGTLFAGTTWKSFLGAAAGDAVGSYDPLFYPDKVTQAVTLVTGYVTVTNVPIRSATASGFTFTPTDFSGAALTVSYRTGAYSSGGAATAVGALGTASVSITALVAAGTFNTNDVSTGLLTITN